MSLQAILLLHPLASLSSLATYLLLIALCVPYTRRILEPRLVHPIPPHQRYLNAFDTYRGFAASLVAIGHCWWATYPVFAHTQYALQFIAYNAKAVPIFAVLSGFLIYRSTLSIKTIEDLRKYAIRRFFRIYPVYIVGVFLCLFYGQYVSIPDYNGLSRFVADAFMLQTVNWPAGFGNPPTWSLYVEVMFYAYLPLLVLTIGRSRMVWFSAGFLVVLLLADTQSRVLGLWKFFSIGIVASETAPHVRKFALPCFVAGVAMLWWDFYGPAHDWFADFGLTHRHMDGETIGLGLSTALILMSSPHLDWVGRAFNILPLRLLGLISYSLYVTHFFYISANFPEIGLFSSLGSPEMKTVFEKLPEMPFWYLPLVFFPGVYFWALISFLLVESPGMRFGRWLANRGKFGDRQNPEPQGVAPAPLQARTSI